MSGHFKRLGCLVVTLFMVNLISASAAMAVTPFWFNSDGSPTTLNGSEAVEHGYAVTVDGGTVKCKQAHYTGVLTGTTATTFALAAAPSGCTLTGALTATVDMNGCFFMYHTDNYTGGTSFDVVTTIECSKFGEEITITVENAGGIVKCVIHIPSQSVGTGVTFNNYLGVGITAGANISGLVYSQTEGTGVGKCATADNTNNGTLTVDTVIIGTNEGGLETAIWFE